MLRKSIQKRRLTFYKIQRSIKYLKKITKYKYKYKYHNWKLLWAKLVTEKEIDLNKSLKVAQIKCT